MKLPEGFSAASCSAGLKSSGALDLTLVVNNVHENSAYAT